MKKIVIYSCLVALCISCYSSTKEINVMDNQNTDSTNNKSTIDTTPKVTGIGGIFFFSDNPKETKEWYSKNLGFDTDDYGSSFKFRNIDRPDEVSQLQWSPFKRGSDYFEPSKKEFMINYQVQNIEGLVDKLKENGVTVLDSIASYDYGKFVHIMDTEGNKIELWEPVNTIQPK
jgi:predicted enzyme related to lactoylglutathione lyase